MNPDVWIIDELEREEEQGPEGPRPELDLDRRVHDEDTPKCQESTRGVRILDISPTHDNEIDL